MDYEFKTTFWQDFTIAELFGEDAIVDTFNRAFNEWKSDYIYLTELVIVTNWKSWEHYNKHNPTISQLYAELFEECNDYALRSLKGLELRYFLKETD